MVQCGLLRLRGRNKRFRKSPCRSLRLNLRKTLPFLSNSVFCTYGVSRPQFDTTPSPRGIAREEGLFAGNFRADCPQDKLSWSQGLLLRKSLNLFCLLESGLTVGRTERARVVRSCKIRSAWYHPKRKAPTRRSRLFVLTATAVPSLSSQLSSSVSASGQRRATSL